MHNDTVEMNVFLSSSKYDSSDNDNDKSVFSLSDLWSLTKSQKFMIRAGLIISWGGFVYGYDIGVIAGTLRQIEDKFQLNDYETGLVVGLLPVGSIFGCMFGGPLCDYVGRWRTIIILNIIYIFGTLIIATASNVWHIYIGRYVIGIATALSGIADVPFLNEMSPPEYRGALCSTYELMAMLGILFAFLITWLVSELNSGDNDWRILYIFPAIFAVMQVLAMVYLPESPKWLITKNLDTEAKKSLSLQLNDSDDLDSKFQEMKLMVHNHNIAESRSRSSFLQTCYLYRIPFICIIILAFFQQFTGGVLVRNYAPRIFENAGFGLRASQLFTILLGVIKVGCCILSMIYVDKIGRKILLLIGISITGSGMLILAIAFSIGYDKSIGIFVFACSLILGGYSVGFGPVVWLLQSEMFPITIRGRAVAISVIARNISEFIVNFSFLPLISSIGNAGAFFFYFAMCICAFVFVSVFIVETMNSEPEEILKYFDKNILVSRRKAKANFVRVPSMDISGKDDC